MARVSLGTADVVSVTGREVRRTPVVVEQASPLRLTERVDRYLLKRVLDGRPEKQVTLMSVSSYSSFGTCYTYNYGLLGHMWARSRIDRE